MDSDWFSSCLCILLIFISKSENNVFSETIEGRGLVGRCRQQIELIKICEYIRTMSFFDFGPRCFTYENLNVLISETTGRYLTKYCILAFRNKETTIH